VFVLGRRISCVGECMTLTIGLNKVFNLCTFDSPYNLGKRGFMFFC